MRRFTSLTAASIVPLFLLIGSARTVAQEDSSKPKPAAGTRLPIPGVPGDQEEQQPGSELTPDTRPLTGIPTPSLGSPELRHSYSVPGFQYGNFVRSSSINQPTSSGWNTTSFVTGNLSLLEAWSRSQLSINYTGGGSFSTDNSQGNDSYHQLGLVKPLTGGNGNYLSSISLLISRKANSVLEPRAVSRFRVLEGRSVLLCLLCSPTISPIKPFSLPLVRATATPLRQKLLTRLVRARQ